MQTLSYVRDNHTALLLDPSADLFAGGVVSKAVNMGKFGELTGILAIAPAATGHGTFKARACDDAEGTNPVDVGYRFRKTGDDTDVFDNKGVLTYKAAGETVQTAVNGSFVYEIIVKRDELPDDKPYVLIDIAESQDNPVPGCLVGVLSKPNITSQDMASAFTDAVEEPEDE